MSLMDLVYKIMPQLNKNNIDSEQDKLKRGVVAVQNAYDESETKKEANQNAMNTVIETIQAHPEMPVGEFLKMIQQNTDLSDSSLVEIIKQIPDVKSEEAAVEAVKKVDLASEAITEIIQEAPVTPATAQKIAEQIPNKDIKKEQQEKIEKWEREEQRKKDLAKEKEVLSQLEEIYEDCEKINDMTLADRINELHIEKKTEKISEKLEDIIAKRVALDCMEFGGPKLPTLMRIMPAIDMFEADLPNLVEKEYKEIKAKYDDQGKDYHQYAYRERNWLKEKLLENIARKVAENFEEIGDISVPPIEQFKNLNEDEMNFFINAVNGYCKKGKLSAENIERIQKQLNGDTVEEWENLQRMLERMKPKDRENAVRDCLQVLKIDENKTQKQKELDEAIANIGACIRELPYDKRLSTAKTIINALEQQQEAIDMWKKHQKSRETENKVDTDTKKKGEETSVGENR